MDISLFFKGLVVGLLIATPVGPIGVLCIQRTLNEGKIQGLTSGLGAATADAVYALIAVFGLTFISNLLVKEEVWLRLVGGVFLCYMGVKVSLSKPVQRATLAGSAGYFSNYVSAFFLTLTNPVTFLAFAAIFAGIGVVSTIRHYVPAILLVVGVFVGSGLWWFILSTVAATFLEKLIYSKLGWLNKVSGIVIAGFGLFVLLTIIV